MASFRRSGAAVKRSKKLLLVSGFFSLLLPVLVAGAAQFSRPQDTAWLEKAFWIAEPLLLSVFFFSLAVCSKKNPPIYLCVGLASIFLALAGAEIYYRLIRELDSYGIYAPSSFLKNPEILPLGSGLAFDPAKGYMAYRPQAVRLAGAKTQSGTGHVLYDVIYTLNSQGWRITPEHCDTADTAVVLFGCSFTIGEGVKDDQAYAYLLAEKLGEKYQVFNFALQGYGAHQMLAQIESGLLKPIRERYKHVRAFYLTIAAHPARCIGFANYRNTGVKYALRDGHVLRDGLLTGANSMAAPDAVFGNFALYHYLFKPLAQRLHKPDALELHTALIAESAKKLRREYNADFTVLVWPDFPQIIDALKASSLRALSLAPAMPDWENKHPRYELASYDAHPNALGHKIIAEELFKQLRPSPFASQGR